MSSEGKGVAAIGYPRYVQVLELKAELAAAEAEGERLRALVKSTYAEAWTASPGRYSHPDLASDWEKSHSRKALNVDSGAKL